MSYKKNISVKFLFFIAFVACSSIFLNAQSKEKNETISTRPFGDGVRHWYGIKDKNNIIDPVPDQPRYDESNYTKIADNMILFQRNNGGWPKNYDMRAILTPEQVNKVVSTKHILHTTFDNSTTYPHIYYLAQVYTATKIDKYKAACLKGLDFILNAQYANGGWPQYYPLEKNYSRYITFNDGAYMGIMNLLQKVIDNNPNFNFIDEAEKGKIAKAYNKGLECILNMQIINQGKLTAWCQQHNEVDLSPAWARAFEPPSICNGESAPIVLFLMSIDHPSEKIINAIQSAVKWFEDSKIYNTKIETFKIESFESKFKTVNHDRRVVIDSTAPPIWTRYYELGTAKPLFCDRNSEFLYSMAEVSVERRNGYAWYTYAPQNVLEKYTEWQNKWVPSKNVLKPVESGVYSWSKLLLNNGSDRELRNIFEGVSPHFEYLEMHATTQLPGAKPNKPNANDAIEELIIVKEGLMKVTIGGESKVVGAGSVILFMPKEMHAIENVGSSNLTYYIMSYKSKKPMDIERGQTHGGSMVYNANDLGFKPSAKGGGIRYFDRPTSMCERFEMHITQLDKKGPSHKSHTHLETEIILIISGNAEMIIDGKTYKGTAGDLFLANSQLLHGIANASDEPCKYFAFKWN